MAKPQKKYYYECIMMCDVPWYGADNRKERWVQKGKLLVQPTHTMHSIRCYPSKGYNPRGELIPGDYIATDRPIAKHYTEEVEKQVSRVDWNERLAHGGTPRKMVAKTSKVKFRLLEDFEVTDYIRRSAYDFGEQWGEQLFTEIKGDVRLPGEIEQMAKEGARELAKKGE